MILMTDNFIGGESYCCGLWVMIPCSVVGAYKRYRPEIGNIWALEDRLGLSDSLTRVAIQ